jgi:hypothetical protein
MATIVNWQQFKNSFASIEQDTVQELIDLYINTQTCVYFSEFTTHNPDKISVFIESQPGPINTNSFYLELCQYIFDMGNSVSVWYTEDRIWEEYVLTFPDVMQNSIRVMTKDLRKPPINMTWAIFRSSTFDSILGYMEAYPNSRKDIVKGYAYYVAQKRSEVANGWTAIEAKYKGKELEAIIDFSIFLQEMVRYEDFENLLTTKDHEMASYLYNFVQYYNTQRIYAEAIAEQLIEKSIEVSRENFSDEVVESRFIELFDQSRQGAIGELVLHLKQRGLIYTVRDIQNLPSYTGIENVRTCTPSTTAHELQYNGDFKLPSGGWFDTSGLPLQNLNGSNGTNLYVTTGPILSIGKKYRITIQIVSCTNNGDLRAFSSPHTYHTFTAPGTYTIEITAVTSTLFFVIDRFKYCSIKEIVDISCNSINTIQEADDSQPQIDHFTPIGVIEIGYQYRLRINSSDIITYTSTANTIANVVTGITNAINNAASIPDNNWQYVTATDDGTHVIITSSSNDVAFSLELVSIKNEVLSLSESHNFYQYLAQEFLSFSTDAQKFHYKAYNFRGQLLKSNGGLTGGYSIKARYSNYPKKSIGTYITQPNGYFNFQYKVAKPLPPSIHIYIYIDIQVLDGDTVLTSTTIAAERAKTTIYPVTLYESTPAISYPTITQVAADTSLTIPPALITYLNSNNIITLKDIRKKGGLGNQTNLPSGISKETPAVIMLDAHADLSTISPDYMANQTLINNGYKSLLNLGMGERTDVVRKYVDIAPQKIGGFNALRVHTLSKSYFTFLQNIITGHKATARTNSNLGKIPELDNILEEKCLCDDCESAVSPLAYLLDLTNYVSKSVRANWNPLTPELLTTLFFQNFKELPSSCEDMDKQICQQRIAVEILRGYIKHSTNIPNESQTIALNKAIKQYCANVYRFLLIQLGTSYEELRELRSGSSQEVIDKKTELASRLKIYYNPEDSYDPFSWLFRDIRSNNLTETFLEEVFGLQDTSRNQFSNSLKLGDTNQITRWNFRGVEWGKNTDAYGYIYQTIDAVNEEIRFYKNASQTSEYLVATAQLVEGKRYVLVPENESDLSGEILLEGLSNNPNIYYSLIPLVTSWKLQEVRNFWNKQDYKTYDYIEHTIPIIDPDILSPDDFRTPSTGNLYYDSWLNRRIWVDEQLNDIRTGNTTDFVVLLNKMATEISYSYGVIEIDKTPWDTVPSDTTLQNYYNTLKKGNQPPNEEAYQEAYEAVHNTLHFEIAAFLRFYELYAATKINDEKGIEQKITQTPGSLTPQISQLIPSGVNKGDVFSLTLQYNPALNAPDISHKATYIVQANDGIPEIITGLYNSILNAGGQWNNISATNEPTLLNLEANDNDTTFLIKGETYRAPKPEGMEEVYSILTQVRKHTFYPDWIEEETENNLSINSVDFWPALSEPIPGTWPVANSGTIPLIDPERITLKELATPIVASTARTLWHERNEQLGEQLIVLKNIREANGIYETFSAAWGENYLGTYTSLDELLAELNNLSNPQQVEEATVYIKENLYTTPDSFRLLMVIKDKATSLNPEAISTDEWDGCYTILTSSYKERVFYSEWLLEENTSSITYWNSIKALLPVWRGSTEQRKNWKNTLEYAKRDPIIDPDMLRPDFLKSIDQNTTAYTIWNNRNNELADLFDEIKTLRQSQSSELEGFDTLIHDYITPTEESIALRALWEQYQAGENIQPNLTQLNLSFDSLGFLLDIRGIAESSPGAILNDEWNEVYSIVLRTAKERLYSQWNNQEKNASLVLSPDYFKISEYRYEDYTTEDNLHQMRWRFDEKVRRNWINKLDARITDEQSIYNNTSDSVDKAEEEYMKTLRDAFVMATNVPGTKLSDKAKNISDKLLFDAENNCCQKMTRVSQALETLQGLLFSVRLGIIQDTYPGFNSQLMTDRFDEEWEWMGSYATWRAAMFINIYPENLLHPSYRKNQSPGFIQLSNTLRNDMRLTPAKAGNAVDKYFKYFEDVCKLELVASCTGSTIRYHHYKVGAKEVHVPKGAYKSLQYLFAKGGKTGNYYWSTLEIDSTSEYAHSFWYPLEAFNNVNVSKILGAVTWKKTDSETFLLFFAETETNGKKKIAYASLNLDTAYWDTEITELDIPEAPFEEAVYIEAAVNIEYETEAQANILLAINFSNKLYIYELNKKGLALELVKANVFNDYPNDLNNIQDPHNSSVQKTHLYVLKKLYAFVNRKLITNYKTDFTALVSSTVDVFDTYEPYFNNVKIEHYTSSSEINKILNKLNSEQKTNNELSVNTRKFLIAFAAYSGIIFNPKYKKEQQYNLLYDEKNDDMLYIGKQKALTYISDHALISIITWPDNDFSLDNNDLNILYRQGDNNISCMRFDRDSNRIDLPIYEFMSGLKFATTYSDSFGKVYMLYQSTSGMYKRELQRDTSRRISFNNNVLPIRLEPSVGGPFSMGEGNSQSALSFLKTRIETTYKANMDLPASEMEYVKEAYYFVPMLTALSLQNKGYYTQALGWYKSIYDYSTPVKGTLKNPRPRKIWYGLIQEENVINDFKRIDNWTTDPLNPHAIAETRQNSYTKFTVQSIAQCLLDYANQEFTKDTAETVPKARLLYEEAIELMLEENLLSKDTDCGTSIESVTYDPIDNPEWPEWKPVWLGIKTDLGKIKDKNTLTNTISLINAQLNLNIPLSQKMSVCRDIVDDALANPEMFLDVSQTIGRNLELLQAAMLKLQSNTSIAFMSEDMTYKLSSNYLNAVSLVTALPKETLERKDFYLDWFGEAPKLIADQNPPNSMSVVTAHYPLRPTNSSTNRINYNFVTPSNEQILTMAFINNPLQTVNEYYEQAALYTPGINLNFCVPPNPLLDGVVLMAELNLFKIRNCMNIAGMVRQLDPYAAPTDQVSGIPQISTDGTLNLGIRKPFQPSPHRFEVLLERAKQQVQTAQQIESTLLSMYEKADAEYYNLMKARQDMGIAKSTIKLQDLRVREADNSISLAVLQKERVTIQSNYFNDLLTNGLLDSENNAMSLLKTAIRLQETAANLYLLGGIAGAITASFSTKSGSGISINAGSILNGIAQSNSTKASIASTESQLQSMLASFERRREEWKFQADLANKELQISDQQIVIANDRKKIVEQERVISQLQLDNAEATLEFLRTKFTNADLYNWMAGVLEKVYSYFLQQATASALTAANQLAFERQDNVPPFIQQDYWEAPSDAVLSIGSGEGPDRRGLTGSVRLLQDITKLDQYAFDSDQRKLQLSKTISLSTLDPYAFERFKQTGLLRISTPMNLFDQDFPGHYLRLIKKVKMTVIGLVPPVESIKATLSNLGISYVVTAGNYQRTPILRNPESIALTSTVDATGMFELNTVSSFLNPFESTGVEASWELLLPKATNFFDFETIADVYMTIEYTALDSPDYRSILLKNMDPEIEAIRPYTFRNQFADQWYDLNNPLVYTDKSNNNPAPVTVRFETLLSDFPVNLLEHRIKKINMYFARENKEKKYARATSLSKNKVYLSFTPFEAEEENKPFDESIDVNNSIDWNKVIENTITSNGSTVEGKWALTLPGDIVKKIMGKEITDILFAITYSGERHTWPV